MKLLFILLAAIVLAVSADSEAPSARSCVCGSKKHLFVPGLFPVLILTKFLGTEASYSDQNIVASVDEGYSVNPNPTSPR